MKSATIAWIVGLSASVAACAPGAEGWDDEAGLRRACGKEATDKVEIWHRTDEGTVEVIEVSPAAVQAHMAHGDVPNPIWVDASVPLGGSGLADDPYRRLTDAIAAASEIRDFAGETEWASEVLRIKARPGVYQGSNVAASLAADPDLEAFPLLIDVPGLSVEGSSQLALDEDGLPTGLLADPSSLSLLVPRLADGSSPAQRMNGFDAFFLISQTIDPDGVVRAGNGAAVSGWVFDSGHTAPTARGGVPVHASLVEDVHVASSMTGQAISSSTPHGGFQNLVDTYDAGVSIDRVWATNATACVICLAGGTYAVRHARLSDGTLGVLVLPAAVQPRPTLATRPDRALVPLAIKASASVVATIEDSDLVGHKRMPSLSSSVRVIAVGPETAPLVHDTTIGLVVRNSRLGGSENALMVDGGFVAWANKAGGVPYAVDSAMSVSLEGNTWVDPVKRGRLVVGFNRGQTMMGVLPAGATPYLAGADWTIDLSDGDEARVADAWIDHPVTDRYDVTPETLGNTLVLGGKEIGAPTCTGAFPSTTCTPAIP